jgi:hypothetical protein
VVYAYGNLVSMTRIVKSSSKPPKPRRTRLLKSGRWLLQDAKARFSELVRLVRSEGPQHVTVHGRDQAIQAFRFDRSALRMASTACCASLQIRQPSKLTTAPVLSASRL